MSKEIEVRAIVQKIYNLTNVTFEGNDKISALQYMVYQQVDQLANLLKIDLDTTADIYNEFHQLKNDIISSLSSIADGSEMRSYCDDLSQEVKVSEKVDYIFMQMNQLVRLGEFLKSVENKA
ncbi:hypothetical protein [Enterococcus italicus]|uniref:hypothetical protein n=1 Tax=Enterococcus italicus TaxID=246144 RepID=UPI003F46009E